MFIQFDGDLSDPKRLLADLQLAGIPARSVVTSRWVRTDSLTTEQFDAGGRIDIELMREARPAAAPRIAVLEAFMTSYPRG